MREGDNENARVQVLTNPSPRVPPPNPGVLPWWQWIRRMEKLPDLLTIWVGCNDALGTAVTSDEVIEGDAQKCDFHAPCHILDQKRTLSGADSFRNILRWMVIETVNSYDGTTQRPIIIAPLVPDVTSLPALGRIRNINADQEFHPFADSRLAISIRHSGGPTGFVPLNDAIRNATFKFITPISQDSDGLYGRMSYIPLLRKYVLKRISHLGIPDQKHTQVEVFGEPKTPVLLNPGDDECQGDILREQKDVRRVSERIRDFNRAIVEIWMKPGALGDQNADKTLNEWRRDGRIHVLDTHWLFNELALRYAADHNLLIGDADPLKQNHETLKNIRDCLSITENTLDERNSFDLLQGDFEFIDSFLRSDALPSGLEPYGQRGLVGPDYIHPTRAGQALLANACMKILRNASQKEPSLKLWGALGKGDDDFNAILLKYDTEKAGDPWRPKD